jgi:hypothetical protein
MWREQLNTNQCAIEAGLLYGSCVMYNDDGRLRKWTVYLPKSETERNHLRFRAWIVGTRRKVELPFPDPLDPSRKL